jgi:general secretion pathway protein C
MFALLLLAAELSGPPADLAAAGVIVAPRPERSVALLRSEGRVRIVGVGETAFGGRVVAIGPGKVTLEYSSGPFELRLTSTRPAPAEAVTLKAGPTQAAPAADPGARALQRRDVERRLADEIPRILAETALVPMIEDGQMRGFTLTRVPEGTLLTEAGLKPGDVLTEINGVAVDGLPTLIGLWPKLRSESELRAVVLRNGQAISLSVTLR